MRFAVTPIVGFVALSVILAGPGRAADLALVSRDAAGNPGQADSSVAQGGVEKRVATVLDDGTVFFISQSALTPADNNAVVDYYRQSSDGVIAAIDLPAGLASGNCFWAGADATGSTVYLFRQYSDPTQFDLRFGPIGNGHSLGVKSTVKSAAFAAGGGYGVYERDVSGFRHLFLHDLTSASQTETQFTSGTNGNSGNPAISANGTQIVFSSTASNVAAGDAYGVADVFLYDRTNSAFTLISQRLNTLVNADALTPDISADGQVVCFVSADDSFVSGDTNGKSDVFVCHAGVMQRCSLASSGIPADQDASSPRLNTDGRFVVFVSAADNLAPGVGNGFSQVYLYDRDIGALEALSVTAANVPANADCFAPGISPAGRYVTFVSKATNLVSGITGTPRYQVYRADRGPYVANHPPVASGISLAGAQGATLRFGLTATDADHDLIEFRPAALPAHGTLRDANGSALLSGQSYGAVSFPWQFVPTDGSLFTDNFTFRATDGKADSAVATAQIRMVDPTRGAITRVSVATDGTQGSLDSYMPYPALSISADGSLIAFGSAATLDPTDLDGGIADIYLRDTVAGSTRLVTTGGAGNKIAYSCALAGDGRSLVYFTEDGNALVLQDVASGARQAIPAVSTYAGNSGPGISHDGTRVVYEKDDQVWLFDRAAGTTAKVSVNSQGEVADKSCGDSAISANGAIVAFSSDATNLPAAIPGGTRSVYLRLLDRSETVLISTTQAGQRVENARKPALSATGRFVAFLEDGGGGTGTVYVKNVATGALRQIAVAAANPAISADGRFVCYTKAGTNGRNQLYRADLAGDPATLQLVSNSAGQEGDGASYPAVLSATGRLVAFAANATNLVAGDSNGKCDVFLNDFGAPPNHLPVPTLTAVSTAEDAPLVDIPLTYTDTEDNDVQTEIVTGPAHATQFTLSTLRPGQETVTFTYVPVANYNGQDSFTYRCRDGEGWSAPITVTITLRPVNNVPRWTGLPVLWRTQPNQEFRLDLSRFVDDPDTRDAVPDILRFSLPQSAAGVSLDGSVLVLSATAVTGPQATAIRVGVTDREGGSIAEFEHELAINARTPVTLALAKGWNVLSFPMAPEPSAPALLLTQPSGPGGECLYRGPLWYWDAEAVCYRSAETVEPKRGYWVLCPEAASVTLQVAWMPTVDSRVNLLPGWNLVGPVGFGEIATPTVPGPGTGTPIPAEHIWRWDGARYVHPVQSVMECGKGNWIWTSLPATQTVNIQLETAN